MLLAFAYEFNVGRLDAYQQAGFNVEKATGFGHKREMLRGIRATALPKIAQHPPATAIVIGGGLAGCASAYALAQRGIQVTVLEAAPQLAAGASGNPRGILHARFGAGNDPLHRFVLAAYGYTLAWLDQVLPIDGKQRAECGLLQLACNPNESKRIARLSSQPWPEHLLQYVDAMQASQHVGMMMAHGGLWFPAAGWVVPPALCAALLAAGDITAQLNHHVTSLSKTATGWRVTGCDAQQTPFDMEAHSIVVCNAHAASQLAPFAHYPLLTVRGQISFIPATTSSQTLRGIVCGDGYCTPAVDSLHIVGASHAFDDNSVQVRATDHVSNLAKIAAYAPELQHSLDTPHTATLAGRAALRCSVPGSAPLIGRVQEGLYCSLAHGTRGLISTGIAAEIIAAQLCGQLAPLPQDLLIALAPQRITPGVCQT